MLGDQTSIGYYFANLQPALASAYDSGTAGGREAWQRSQTSGLHPDYRDTRFLELDSGQEIFRRSLRH